MINDVHCTCKIQWYTIAMLLLVLLGIMLVITINVRKLRLFRGHLFSNVVKGDAFHFNYVPIKLCRVEESIHLFHSCFIKLVGNLTSENVTLKRNLIWDLLELDWKEVSMTLHGNKINLPTSVIIIFRDKLKIRWLVSSKPLLLHIMLKQSMTNKLHTHTLTMRVLAAVNKLYSYLSQHRDALFLK